MQASCLPHQKQSNASILLASFYEQALKSELGLLFNKILPLEGDKMSFFAALGYVTFVAREYCAENRSLKSMLQLIIDCA
jgi:hypothetical protein